LKGGEGPELSNDLLRRGHGPSEPVRIPFDGFWRFDVLTFEFNGGDLGDVMVDELLLDSEGMPEGLDTVRGRSGGNTYPFDPVKRKLFGSSVRIAFQNFS
jgi:hypothetical protein